MKWRSLDESAAGTDVRPLREQFAERKQVIAQYVPAETQAVHTRVISDLKRNGIETKVLNIGSTAPAFELPDQNGKIIFSRDLLSKNRLVMCFFRGRWCPFCVGQLEAMNRIVDDISGFEARLIAISPQTVQQSFFMSEQHKLRFPLLSDEGNRIARQFGLVYRVPEDQQAIYRRVFVNLPLANGDESWELPVPATFILNSDGIISYRSVNADYTTRPEPLELLQRLAER